MLYELVLNEEGTVSTDSTRCLVLPAPRADEGYTLRLLLSATAPVVHEGKLLTNYPPRGTQFDRNIFHEFSLDQRGLDSNVCVDLDIFQSGTFAARIEYTAVSGLWSEEKTKKQSTEEWNFVVAGSLNPDELCVQTLLSKLMPSPSSTWDEGLRAVADKGYNMIHFVPLQVRGGSDSPFALADQLSWDPVQFPNGEDDVRDLTSRMRKLGLRSLSDIVLNHTAYNSPWLSEHSEAGYSVENSPHLGPALALDDGLLELSKTLAAEGVEIDSPSAIAAVISRVKSFIDGSIKLWQFYVVSTEGLSDKPGADPVGSLSEAAAQLTVDDSFSSRYGRKLELKDLDGVAQRTGYSQRQLVDAVNVPLYAEYQRDLAEILKQIEGRLRYLRLELKVGSKISSDHPIIETYFTRLDGGIALANNGWVWAGNSFIDHAGPKSKVYLLRQLVVWGDCVKLRYGEGPEDNPWLWDYMSKYAELMARNFDGIRIDNAHSTPIHVGEYILDTARRVQPELYVVAELFSGSQEVDKMYVEHLGISSLLREALNAGTPRELSTLVQVNGGLPIGSFRPAADELVRGIPTHAWLMEVTHDNQMPAQKRTVEDTLATAGLVAMCTVSSGSTMGADECYPCELNVVTETRKYVWGGGISRAKRVINHLHTKMAQDDMYESYTDLQGPYISVHRKNPRTGKGIYLIARTKWQGGPREHTPVVLEKTSAEYKAGWWLEVRKREEAADPDRIVPISTKLHDLPPPEIEFDGGSSTLHIELPAGGVAIFATSQTFDTAKLEMAVDEIPPLDALSLIDLNVLLYRADGEERAATGGGVYTIPNYGPLIYAGLQGWETVLRPIVRDQDLGHSLCSNVREGLWVFDHIINRLTDSPLSDIGKWMSNIRDQVTEAPSNLRPRYFAAAVLGLYDMAVAHAAKLLNSSVDANQFWKRLNLTSIQMVASLPNVSLWPDRNVPTLAAGLPHFSEGVMRVWGRDVFLSFSGLLLTPKRIDIAREHILGFGATLKYGLIPNLLDSGDNPRYNARDAVWFYAQSVQDYCKATGSLDILNTKTTRRFPLDDSWTEQPTDHESTIGELLIEILDRHARGITFREHNAGKAIDEHMKSEGFNQSITVDKATGIILGGSQNNCGTWQDKMGESILAGSDGVPGTPRDGAAVEITGLLKSLLRWVNELRRSGEYQFPKEVGDGFSLDTWENLVQDSFEHCYFIPEDQDEGYDVNWGLVNRRGVYKDLWRSSKEYEDYQLRANWPIAYVVAPELFDNEHARVALRRTDEILRGPVGMATLDPSDWNYRPFYINSVDSKDFATARGRNYHQGPEWVWLEGVFLQALILHDKFNEVPAASTRASIRNRIKGHVKWLRESPWVGLTELTQRDGEFCPDSSPTQAWSSARLLQALDQLE